MKEWIISAVIVFCIIGAFILITVFAPPIIMQVLAIGIAVLATAIVFIGLIVVPLMILIHDILFK